MSKKRNLAIAFILGVATFYAGSQVLQAATELARVNNHVISLEDFNRKYSENLKFFQFKAPTKKSVLDELINRELGIEEARKMGLDKNPDVVDRMNTVLYQALLDKKLSKEFEGIYVTDEQARQYYAKNPEIRTSHIFVAVPPNATPAQVKKAYDKIKAIAQDQLSNGKMSFAEVAQRFSEGVAAPMGGDIDYQTKDKLDPTYYATALALKTPGKVSGIVRTPFGFHIIKLTAIRSWEEADKAQVKRMVFDERRNEIFESYMAKLRGHAKIAIHHELIKN
jgi:peptidyl-prolyl cis-trans isomerase C/peptidyl-prolyl cis-trans isomerase D